ncbi:hypothetical protein V6N12_003217 [Hibiscus sabdariffa]|uniref:Uncharacterized protein n=1 Tax=Hibiscus sabdariffa TaxID=183260 RepID=A0ABR2EDD2_9ROSI
MEDRFDEVVPGTSGITKERLPMLMGLKGGKAKESTEEHPQSGAIQNVMAKLEKLEESVKGTKDRLEALTGDLKTFFAYVKQMDEVMIKVYEEMIPHMPANLPVFPDELLPTAENVTASPEADQQQDQEGPQEEDPINPVPMTEEQEPRPQPQAPAEPQPRSPSVPTQSEQGPKALQEGSVEAPNQSEMSGQVSPSKGGRGRKARAGQLVSPSSAKNLEGPSDTPDAHASDPEASPTPQRKRTRRTTTSSPPPP